ncbi:sulfatase-like hydrolase/transferase [Candidatus Epulonipiscium viviparus]|uniref:sulfatase-like hydrolase/transferase n=1 Tax=Candidatus Epulonipiscium viviparus TaxID=420336 RepID=UPI0027381175|nr:sulfatase-like hydrolase/transferase [Candidatus Epulopiscium viviparus]
MSNPNVLIIMTDQQTRKSISALGAVNLKTPNLDRIATEGAIFENFFTPTAVCTPSRGSFVTGLYPIQHGCTHNNNFLYDNAKTIAEVFKDSDYQTGYAGKWHLNGDAKPGFMTSKESRGFDSCKYMYNRGHWKSIVAVDGKLTVAQTDELTGVNKVGDENTYTTDVLSKAAINFIESRDKTRPFLYMVSIPDPHTPVTVREPYASMYNPADIILPENFYKSNAPWAPEGTYKTADNNSDGEAAKKWMALYYGEVSCIDDNVGKILQSLENEGILDDTIIVFTTDHGEYMGEHGLWRKGQLYPEVNHVPFFVRYPKKITANTRITDYVSAIDMLRTVASLAEVENTSCDVGQDATALLRGDNSNWDGVQYLTGYAFRFTAIIKDGIFAGFRHDGKNLLFDMEKDPLNNNNLYDDPAYAVTKKNLYEAILKHEIKLNSPCVAWLKDTQII